jgi:coenzyme PQQ precursor peptide PqqA
MNTPSEFHNEPAPAWEPPSFQEIPIAFEATSYALTDDDDPIYR